uniref:J domain-containing protein n=1 Tax=Globodera rostochiensis TaxID=31243 RepID=A0A914HNA2_GLORO
MDFDDPFEVLELNPCSDKVKIKTAYRQMALKCHPDKTRTADTEPFRRIKKAYDYLWKMAADKLAQFARNFTAQKGHRELVQFLIIAAQNGQINEARSLLKRGADPRGTGTVTVTVDGQMISGRIF